MEYRLSIFHNPLSFPPGGDRKTSSVAKTEASPGNAHEAGQHVSATASGEGGGEREREETDHLSTQLHPRWAHEPNLEGWRAPDNSMTPP